MAGRPKLKITAVGSQNANIETFTFITGGLIKLEDNITIAIIGSILISKYLVFDKELKIPWFTFTFVSSSVPIMLSNSP